MPKNKKQPRMGSIQQTFIGAKGINRGVLELHGNEYCAVVEVSSLNFLLMSETDQEATLAAYQTFINNLTFPVQIIIRVQPLDIRPYLTRMRDFARQWRNILLGQLAVDHLRFVINKMKKRTLLDRRFYIVVTTDPDVGDSRGARKVHSQSQAQNILSERCNKIINLLDRVGLKSHRLVGSELAQVYYESWNVERAIRRPLTNQNLAAIDWPLMEPVEEWFEKFADDQQAVAPQLPTGMVGWENHESPAGSRPPQLKGQRKIAKNLHPDDEFTLPNFADMIAPSAIEVKRDSIIIDDSHISVFALAGYPRYIFSGWTERLIGLDEPMELVFFIHPQDSAIAIRRLTRRLTELEATANMNRTRGRLDAAENTVAINDIDKLRLKLQRGDEHYFTSSLYVCMRGKNVEELHQRIVRITSAIESLQMKLRPCTFEEDMAFMTCLPEGRDRLLRTHAHDTTTLTVAFPFISSSMTMPDGVLFGSAPNGAPIIIDMFSPTLENANKVIFAKSGAGKSFACKVEAMRNLIRGIDTYIIDPENEYWPIAQSVGGQVIHLSAGSPDHINPLDMAADPDSPANSIIDKIQSLHLFFDLLLADRSPMGVIPLTQREKSLLDMALNRVYSRAGITSDPSTHLRPMPLLEELYKVLQEGQDRTDETHLADRLYRYVHGSIGLFSQPTNVDLNNKLVIFDIHDINAELRPIVLYMITEFVWSHISKNQRLPRQLIIDEAWTLMQFAEGGEFLASLARRARKYFLSLVTITQDIDDFLNNEHGRTILNNSSIKLLMKQDSSSIERLATTFRLSPIERQFLLSCQKGQGLLFARQTHVGIQVEASPMEYKLATTDPRDFIQQPVRSTGDSQ